MSQDASSTRLISQLGSKEVVAAAIGALLTGVLGLIGLWWFQQKADARVRIVDVTVAESQTLEPIDIKLRNTGDRVAFVKQVRLDVMESWSLQPTFVATTAVRPSAEYKIVLPVMVPPFSISAPVSHALPADAVDQFRLNVEAFGEHWTKHHFVLITITVLHDETSASETSAPLLIATGPRFRLEDMYSSRPDSPLRMPSGFDTFFGENGIAENIRQTKEIAALDVPKSPFAADVLKEVLRKQVKDGK